MGNTFQCNTAGLKLLSSLLISCQPGVMAAFRKSVNDDGGPLIGGRAAELSAWSKKIPRTIRWRTTGNMAKVTLIVSAGYKGVPIAKWYELGHTQDHSGWWHPAWPHGKRKSWKWVPQAKGEYHRPYLYPALQERQGQVAQVAMGAIIDATVAAIPYMNRVSTVSTP